MEEEVKIDGNTEIQKALKEFEEKSAAEQNSYKAVKLYNETNTPKIVKLVMKYSGGAIKEERQAEYVLLGFVVIAIGISLYLFFGGGRPTSQKIPAAVLEQMKQIPINR